MKLPCELIVTHILPTARGSLAKELVKRHGMTQVQVAHLFGVTSAAVSQYLKGLRGGNNLIDKSAYRDEFYGMIADAADAVAAGGNENFKRGVVHYGRGGREKGGEIRDRRDKANAAVFLSQNKNAAARRIPDRGGSAGCAVMSGQWGRATGWQCLTTCAACSVCPRRGGAS